MAENEYLQVWLSKEVLWSSDMLDLRPTELAYTRRACGVSDLDTEVLNHHGFAVQEASLTFA